MNFNSKNSTYIIDEPEPRPIVSFQPSRIILYKNRIDGKRYHFTDTQQDHDSEVGSFLGTVKRVYGGAFAGNIASLAEKEDAVIRGFLAAAASCSCKSSKTIRARRKLLHAAAAKVMAPLHELLDHEVNVHLRRLATTLLAPMTRLGWNPLTNSCQQFADYLLKGKDFDHIYPLFPQSFTTDAAVRASNEFPWPRYLLSFHDRIDGFHHDSQPKSIISEFCQNRQDRCDIIDFGQNKAHLRDNKETGPRFVDHLFLVPEEIIADVFASAKPGEAHLDRLWELPRDALSVLQSHILRPSEKYTRLDGSAMNPRSWVENRLRVLQQLDLFASFAGSLGLAFLNTCTANPRILRGIAIPHARALGTIHADEKIHIIYHSQVAWITYIVKRKGYPLSAVELPTAVRASLGLLAILSANLYVSLSLYLSLAPDKNGCYITKLDEGMFALHARRKGKSLRRETSYKG